jgi:hypothetical protein
MPKPNSALVRPSLAFFAVCAVAALPATPGCMAQPADETDVVATQESELRLPFTAIDVRRPNARAGITLLRSAREYRAFFGVQPPADLNFAREAVLHFSTGVKPTGGYAAEILSVDLGWFANRVVVHARDTAPGQGCLVTQALTNPQVAVRFAAPRWPLSIALRTEKVVTNCEEPPFCASVLCPTNTRCDEERRACIPIDSNDICTLPADPGTCKALMPMWTFDAARGACVPFNYGGCEGNANRFVTEAECQRACGR